MISQRIATAIEDINAAISSVSVTAPTGGDTAALSISVAKFGGSDMPADISGVAGRVITRAPNHVELIEVANDIDRQIISSAWHMGAWDVQRITYPAGYTGTMDPHHDDLVSAMRASGWTTWTYRPMVMAPEVRQKAWSARDTTLLPIMLGRSGPAPLAEFPAARPGHLHVLRLGRDPSAKHRTARHALRATGKQRAYIVALRRGTPEQGSPLPANLTRKEASNIIDRLLSNRHD